MRTCASSCSPNLYEYTLNISSNVCLQYCPSPLFAQNANGSNTSQCVSTCNVLGLPSTRTCEAYCPHPYFADLNTHLCVLTCAPALKYIPTRSCLSTCIAPYYGNPLAFTCDFLCPPGYFGRNDTQRCDTGCPSGSYADSSIRICVSNCPASPLFYADDRYNQCVDVCGSPLFGYQENLTCVSSCPNATIGGQLRIFLADASNRLCVLACVNA